jgi:hypothetical protein
MYDTSSPRSRIFLPLEEDMLPDDDKGQERDVPEIQAAAPQGSQTISSRFKRKSFSTLRVDTSAAP